MVVNLTPSMVRSLRDLTSNPIPLLRSISPRLTDQRFPNTHAPISELLRVPLAHSLMFIVQLLLALTFLRRVIIVPISRLPRLLLEVATKDIVPSTPDLDLDVVTSTPMRTTVSRDTPAPTTALMV